MIDDTTENDHFWKSSRHPGTLFSLFFWQYIFFRIYPQPTHCSNKKATLHTEVLKVIYPLYLAAVSSWRGDVRWWIDGPLFWARRVTLATGTLHRIVLMLHRLMETCVRFHWLCGGSSKTHFVLWGGALLVLCLFYFLRNIENVYTSARPVCLSSVKSRHSNIFFVFPVHLMWDHETLRYTTHQKYNKASFECIFLGIPHFCAEDYLNCFFFVSEAAG